MAGPHPEQRVTRPMLLMRWESLTLLHWPYPPATVQRLLPDGLSVDTWEDAAWVAITPFVMTHVRPPGLPTIPGLSTFPETNVRTYVRDRTGRDGLWFLSLDTTRAAALGARGVGIPYFWSAMEVSRGGDDIDYTTSHRRVPADMSAFSRIRVRPRSPFAPSEIGGRDHFLTGRWRAFSRRGRRLFVTPVEHPPWPLWRAETTMLDSNIVAVAGLPPPAGAPVVHYSPGVDVRLGFPQRVP